MQVEFPFVKQTTSVTEFISRAYAEVILVSGLDQIKEWFFIDSGADVSLITKSIGEALGFTLKGYEEIKELSGISKGGIPYVLRTINMKIGEKEFEARVAWSLLEDVPLVLGRLDIFNKFDITFKEREGKVVFVD